MVNVLERHLSALIQTASYPYVQKFQIIRFFFENVLHWQFAVRLLQFTVPASKPFDHALFEVQDAITLYCT